MLLFLFACHGKGVDSTAAEDVGADWYSVLSPQHSRLELELTHWVQDEREWDQFVLEASFYTGETGTGPWWPEVLEPRSGEEDCGLVRYLLREEDIVAPASAGPLSLTAPDGSATVEPVEDLYEELLSLSPQYEADYSVSAPGEVFPGFSVETMTMPPDLQLSAPDLHQDLPTGDVAVEWDGKGGEPLYVFLSSYVPGTPEVTQVQCLVSDDGAFVIPAALRDALPASPNDGYVAVTRAHRWTVDDPSLVAWTTVTAHGWLGI